MSDPASNVDPIPFSAYPTLQTQPAMTPPVMPSQWSAVALLQPFSPPQDGSAPADSPFYQLCIANLSYAEGGYFSAQIAGTQGGTWWYIIEENGFTTLSTDQGSTWTQVEMGWQLPTNGWFGNSSNTPPTCAGSSPLNWMNAQTADWWKIPVNSSVPDVFAATWMWFDSQSQYPVRMMYGQGPPAITQGDPTQLPLLQMYSFTYFPSFSPQAPGAPAPWAEPMIEGFSLGNPSNYSNFVFNANFGMTALMTPVNEQYNPLPTRVLYVWKPDSEYSVYTDRAQNTLMLYTYNPDATDSTGNIIVSQEALLTGPSPVAPGPQYSDTSYLITNYLEGSTTPCSCAGPAQQFDFPQEAPNWISNPGVEGTIQATITNNPVLCPNTTILIYSALFPPAEPNYPQSTYLWTWYAPLSPDGTLSRPVTFMQSQSALGVGTSLALADYFDFEVLQQPIDPANFAVPACCD